MTHSKNLIPLLYLLIKCMLPRSAPQVLSSKEEQTLRLLNFLIIHPLCSSSGICCLDMDLFLVAPLPADFVINQ